jgi:hypothetical protein
MERSVEAGRGRISFSVVGLVATLVLNGALAAAGAKAVHTLQSQLEELSTRTQRHAEVTERTAESLAHLGAQSSAMVKELVDVRSLVSTPTREEMLFLKVLILKPGVEHALARRIAKSVQSECERTNQDPNLVLSVMAVESGFNPNAVSAAGAVGLMQVMPLWKKALGVEALNDPETSIRAGVHILQQYQQMYGQLDLTLTAYNRGPGAVNQALQAGEAPQNGYSTKVLSLMERLRAIDLAARQG